MDQRYVLHIGRTKKRLREPVNGLTHLAGLLLACVGLLVLLARAASAGRTDQIVAFGIFGLSLELPSIGRASVCKAGTDAPSFGEFSTLPERKEHAPCPHSHLTSSSPSGNSFQPCCPSTAPTIRSDATALASPSGSSSRSWCRFWSSAAPTTGSPTHPARRAPCVAGGMSGSSSGLWIDSGRS